MVSRLGAAEVLLRVAVEQRRLRAAQHLHEHLLRVRALHAVERIVAEGEVFPLCRVSVRAHPRPGVPVHVSACQGPRALAYTNPY